MCCALPSFISSPASWLFVCRKPSVVAASSVEGVIVLPISCCQFAVQLLGFSRKQVSRGIRGRIGCLSTSIAGMLHTERVIQEQLSVVSWPKHDMDSRSVETLDF